MWVMVSYHSNRTLSKIPALPTVRAESREAIEARKVLIWKATG